MYKLFGIPFFRLLWVFWPLKFFVRISTNPEGIPAEFFRNGFGENRETSVVYVFQRFVLLDLFVLFIFLKKNKMLLPKVTAQPNRFRKVAVLALRERAGLITFNESKEIFAQRLAALLEKDKRVKKGSLILQPVSVYFTRSPERSERNFILRSLFPDDEDATSFQKLLLLLLHGGNVRLHIAQPLIPKVPEEFSDSSEVNSHGWALRLRREVLIEFAKDRTRVLGPALYDNNSIAHWIINSPETQRFINSEPKPFKAKKLALHYIEEIAAKFNYTTIRALEKLLDFVWTRIFEGVRVRNFEAVSEVAKQGQLLWMPCHRSHLDYLLLSYVLNKKGLVSPHIAAGVNLSFWPAGPIFRRGGAFFMRRSFRGNKLYTHIFAQYVDFLVHNSFPLEFFQEGGRSRTGKLLTPKTGLLSFCVSSLIRRKASQAYIIPVYFGYDKVMEDGAYARELQGARKQKESLWQLIKSVRLLFSKYGYVDVSFGAPIRFGDFWKEYFLQFESSIGVSEIPSDIDKIPENLDVRDPRVQGFVRALSYRVNQGINSTAIASGSSLLTASVLAQPESDISQESLRERIKLLHVCVLTLRESLGWTISPSSVGEGELLQAPMRMAQPGLGGFVEQNSEIAQGLSDVVTRPIPRSEGLEAMIDAVVRAGLKWQMIVPLGDGNSARFRRNTNQEFHLWWYRGTIFHLIAVPGLVAAFLLSMPEESLLKSLPVSQLYPKFQFLRLLWQDDAFYPNATSTSLLVQAGVRVLHEAGVLKLTAEDTVLVDSAEKSLSRLQFFANLVAPEREMFALQIATALGLQQGAGSFARDELLRSSVATHRCAFLRGFASHPANHSRVHGAKVFDSLFKAGVYVPQEKQRLAVSMVSLSPAVDFFDLSRWAEFVENA